LANQMRWGEQMGHNNGEQKTKRIRQTS